MDGIKERALDVADSLKKILDGLSETEAEEMLQELLRVKRDGKKVFVAAAGRTNLIMRTFAMRLMQIGFSSYVVFDTNTPAFETGDLLIAASGSGATETVAVIVRQAQKIGGRFVLISKTNDSALARSADVLVRIPTSLAGRKLQTKGSEFEQSLFLFCDTMGVALMKRLGCIEDISEIDGFIRIRHANLQ